MTEHYYSPKPTVKHNQSYLKEFFFGKEFNFITDSGVFSKHRIDFGTSLLIESFKGLKDAKILDLGCGYGPLGIVISSNLNSGEVILADINERAINLAKKNIILNQKLINSKINLSVIQSDGFTRITQKNFNYILLNPPIRAGKAMVYKLYEDSYEFLSSNGELWIVIQKKQGALSSIEKLKTIYDVVDIVIKEKGYYIIKNKK